MPCPGKRDPSRPGDLIKDLYQLHVFQGTQLKPRTRQELVAAVAASARGSRSLRALGTNWALSSAGVADDVVCTDHLDLHVSRPYGPGALPLPTERLRDGGSDFLMRVCSADQSAARDAFVHVEAGVKVHQLLSDLGRCGLALPTMGSSAGQSLGGSLSTGTHGSDFEIPPLVEWIQAVHLVAAGAQEWWITREGSLFADERVVELLGWYDDSRLIANDQAFDAVRVAVGRMGVIYSMILKVLPAHSVVEVNLEHAFGGQHGIRAQLVDSINGLKAGKSVGVFAARLSGLDSGWFRSELLRRSKQTHHGLQYVGGPGGDPQASSATTDGSYMKLLADLGLQRLANELRSGPPADLQSINIAVNLANPEQCWVKRRWRPAGRIGLLLPPEGTREPILQAAIENKDHPDRMIGPLRGELSPGLWTELLLFLDRLFHGARSTRFDQFKAEDIPRIAKASCMSGEALLMTLYKAFIDPILGSEDVRKELVDRFAKLAGAEFKDVVRAGAAMEVLNTPGPDPKLNPRRCAPNVYPLDGVISINSAEFFFDAAAAIYLEFIDRVIALARTHAPIFGVMGIRFTPRATALLAMQRFPRTVSIEIGTGHAHQEDIYKEFWNAVYASANDRGAISHWGQELQQSAQMIAARYGEQLQTWRRMLAELSLDAPDHFSTDFSREHGLEPTEAAGLFDAESMEMFRTAFEGSA